MMEKLKQATLEANLALVRHGLVVLTWGNASAIDRQNGRVVIKPSGVGYEGMEAKDMVVTDLAGCVVEGALKPSSDLQTHLRIYEAWPSIGGVVHTHSPCATAFAQAGRSLLCYGTTHADHFHGSVPVTRAMTPSEVEEDYETNTGAVIVERFRDLNLNPAHMPAVLIRGHGPFVWGEDAANAVENAVALEQTAFMAMATLCLNPEAAGLENHLIARHFFRKHGESAYYGQAGPL